MTDEADLSPDARRALKAKQDAEREAAAKRFEANSAERQKRESGEWVNEARAQTLGRIAAELGGVTTLSFEASGNDMDILRKSGSDDAAFARDIARIREFAAHVKLCYGYDSTANVEVSADNARLTIPANSKLANDAFTETSLNRLFSENPRDKLELALQMDQHEKGYKPEDQRTRPGSDFWNEYRQSQPGRITLQGGLFGGGVEFRDYDLSNVTFAGRPVLTGARFEGAAIDGADFSALTGLDAFTFKNSIRDGKTRFKRDDEANRAFIEQISAIEKKAAAVVLPKGGSSSGPAAPRWGDRVVGLRPEIVANPVEIHTADEINNAKKDAELAGDEIGLEPLPEDTRPTNGTKPAEPKPTTAQKFSGGLRDPNRSIKKPGGGPAKG